jgi:hypothetical protein
VATTESVCPSARCEDGAKLLGIVQPDGTVGYLGGAMTVDARFVERARLGRSPEQRFRFAGACVEGACRQWTGERCGVIDRVLTLMGSETVPAALPSCGIRSVCRWFDQNGPRSCRACPFVVTEAREHAAPRDTSAPVGNEGSECARNPVGVAIGLEVGSADD